MGRRFDTAGVAFGVATAIVAASLLFAPGARAAPESILRIVFGRQPARASPRTMPESRFIETDDPWAAFPPEPQLVYATPREPRAIEEIDPWAAFPPLPEREEVADPLVASADPPPLPVADLPPLPVAPTPPVPRPRLRPIDVLDPFTQHPFERPPEAVARLAIRPIDDNPLP